MFAYCNNNPINNADPSGLLCGPSVIFIDGVKKLVVKLMWIILENYDNNSQMDSNPETTTHNKLINDQNQDTGKNFKYGNYPASHNACEAIAIHNSRVLLGMDSRLSDVMLICQMNLAMIGDGYFGTNPYAIGNILDAYGMPYSNVGISDLTQEGVYIISYWNPGAPFRGLHTVAVTYDGAMYTTYNYYGYGSLDYGNPTNYASNYICGYYLGGQQ